MFADRAEAGRLLGERLGRLEPSDPVVVGLPRGGVPVAFEVARALGAPLDVIVVRKLGVPYQPELAMGAVGEGDVIVLNDAVVREAVVDETDIAAAARRERIVVEQQAHLFRRGHAAVPLAGRTVVIVDDGMATGSTVRAACAIARASGAGEVVVGVPVGPPHAAARLEGAADHVVCLREPANLYAVGQAYADFAQVSDGEVTALLARAAGGDSVDPRPPRSDPVQQDVSVEAETVRLDGTLTVPDRASGIVVFAHGSGSSRHSPRNQYVAGVLNSLGLATLLFDLLTPTEEVRRELVFDVELLGRRLRGATRWLASVPGVPDRIGYFGASTGAAAALCAAADPALDIAAVVSRGGRPDLAGPWLSSVRASTLLVVGELDHVVIDLNRVAQAGLRCPNRLSIVPGASHLFEEPGCLASVARLACHWFGAYLPATSRPGRSVDDPAGDRDVRL
jgi:predicted phosphoribosyltransferase/dienelactone hydrolase